MTRNREETLREKMYANMSKVLIPLFIALAGWVLNVTYNTSIDIAVTKESILFTKEKVDCLKLRLNKIEVNQSDVVKNINNLNMSVEINKKPKV